MRRLGLLILLFACAGGLVPAAAQAMNASSTAELTGFNCQRAVEPAFRAMTVTAVMRPVTGTQAMRLQFVLLEARALHGRYHAVHGHNLGTWIAPNDPTLGQQPGDSWKLSHPVALLSAPAFYRLRVTFRWLGAGGTRLAQAVEQTPICHQLELRPDLLATSVTDTGPAPRAGDEVYVVAVRNRGLTGAGPFDVTLTPLGGTTLTRTVRWVGHHATHKVRFVAPACTAGQTLTVVVDPADAVADDDRSNNTLTVPCPAPATS